MTDKFEDVPPSGSGNPTREQAAAMRDYLKRRNRKHSYAHVADELKATGFATSKAAIGRFLKPDNNSNSSIRPKRVERAKQTLRKQNKAASKPEQVTTENMTPEEKVEIGKILAEFIGPPDALKKNCDIALMENKVRMALNIILMRRMIERPELLMIDMRGAAALIDSLTMASKMSGGASFEVIVPGDRLELDGNGMKDITPNTQVASIDAWRRFRENPNGKGT